MESYPCQHMCTVTYADGETENKHLNGSSLKSLITELAPTNVINPIGSDHFSSY